MNANTCTHLGALIPAHHDGPRARALAVALLAAADRCATPVTIVVADNGENDGFDGGLPEDARRRVVTVTERGPGYARSAAARRLVDTWQDQSIDLDHAWIISLDADTVIPPDFLAAWVATIKTAAADILSGHSILGALPGDEVLEGDVAAASSWLWGGASFLEQFAGIVNVGGCNHAVRASVCAANDYYLQPLLLSDSGPVLVPGDDWDFGLRGRLRGFTVARAETPTCITSVRRITNDPAGFLAGRTYEKAFAPVTDPKRATPWPPDEDWAAMADKGRTRIVTHFLLKPVVAGLAVSPTLGWFLGESLWQELIAAPVTLSVPSAPWQSYRAALIDRLFQPDAVNLARRISHRLLGVGA